jgi:hypothetical protein
MSKKPSGMVTGRGKCAKKSGGEKRERWKMTKELWESKAHKKNYRWQKRTLFHLTLIKEHNLYAHHWWVYFS